MTRFLENLDSRIQTQLPSLYMKLLMAQIQNNTFDWETRKFLITSNRPSPELLFWVSPIRKEKVTLYIAEKLGTALGVLVQKLEKFLVSPWTLFLN